VPGFHAILVVREEGDIIAQTLAHLLSWCDTLHVYDTGSTDDTWDIVQDSAARDSRLVPLGREAVLFNDSLRAWVFERARARFRPGDWVVRADADEFYHIPPPRFVRERLARYESRVCTCQYDFLLSRQDLKDWQEGRETAADRARPIHERRRFFRFDPYPEQRLFRYRRGLRWPAMRYDPAYGGLLARERIPVLHYRARDPLQIQVRCAIREPVADTVPWAAWHWGIPDWRAWVFGEQDLRMVYWAPGTALPEHPNRSFETGRLRGLKEHVRYRTGLVRLLELNERHLPRDFRPTPLDAELSRLIERNLAAIRERPYLRDIPEQLLARRARGKDLPMGPEPRPSAAPPPG
jgi:hypothetical protein